MNLKQNINNNFLFSRLYKRRKLFINKIKNKNDNDNVLMEKNNDNVSHLDSKNNNPNQIKSINNPNQNLEQKIDNDINPQNKILQTILIELANSIIKLMNFDYKLCNKYNNIINGMNNKLNNNSSISFGNPPKRKGENNIEKNENENINVVYYDENINLEDNTSEVFDDSRLFERVISKGIFILATDEKRFKLILEEIQKNNNQNIDFHLIVTGSKCKKVMRILEKDKKLFKKGCIYTGNYNKYKNYINEYHDFIENVYTERDEIISFIKENESDTNIFESYKLINYENYIDKYYNFHKVISEQYKEEILNNGNSYEVSLALLQNMSSDGKINIEGLVSLLQSINDEHNRENIVNEYTNDSIYKIFNNWLNKLDILSYRKISYFIALLMYGINDINDEKKGLKKNCSLYRGLTMSYINLSFFERNINNVITFPSFTSCSLDKSIAEIFCGRKKKEGYEEMFFPLAKRQKDKIFSVMITIEYIYKNSWEPSAFDISEISENSEEKEYIFLPFTFYKIKSVDISFIRYEANIVLENIGKYTSLEKIIQKNNIIEYNQKENIMKGNKQSKYQSDINSILKKEYPWINFEINLGEEDTKIE
jgi:hypothetical protein